MPVLEDDVLLFEAVEDDEEMSEAVGATGKRAKEAGCSCCGALEQTTLKTKAVTTGHHPLQAFKSRCGLSKALNISDVNHFRSESEMTTTANQDHQDNEVSTSQRTERFRHFDISDWLKLRRNHISTFLIGSSFVEPHTPPMSRAHHVAMAAMGYGNTLINPDG